MNSEHFHSLCPLNKCSLIYWCSVCIFNCSETILSHFGQQMNSWKHCLYFISNARDEFVLMYSLNILEVRCDWLQLLLSDFELSLAVFSVLKKLSENRREEIRFWAKLRQCLPCDSVVCYERLQTDVDGRYYFGSCFGVCSAISMPLLDWINQSNNNNKFNASRFLSRTVWTVNFIIQCHCCQLYISYLVESIGWKF